MPEKWAKVDPHPAWCKNSVNDPEVVHEIPCLKSVVEYRKGAWGRCTYSIDEETGQYCIPSFCVILVRVGAKNTLEITCRLIMRTTGGNFQCNLPANIENCEPNGRDEGLTSGNCTGRRNSAEVE